MIRIIIPSLPPSSNNAYFNLPKGGRTLTKEGKRYKAETVAFLASKCPREMTIFKPNKPYALAFRFFFPDIETAGYPKKAKNRYKVFDGGNRMKLLEDCLKDAAGIDDSQTLTSIWTKEKGKEQTVIWAWALEEEECPLHEYVRHLP